ncbi:hypothetical protein [Exiguobacterium sp. s21]|uniref:hypothetical protein n=1 Tax=Exiguobacterium sp. s21 TaxID=2751244 RepID=UPI001BEA210F|nr:hypothetical protein [Exiguobacterium sp. s21]
MAKSPINVEISYYKNVPKKVRQKVPVRRKVNGRYVTRYEYRTVTKQVMTQFSRILPVTPEEIDVSWERSITNSETLALRTYTKPGALRPREIRLNSFFTSSRQYGFTQTDKLYQPYEIAKWFDDRLKGTAYPIQVKITGLGIRGYYHLQQFTYKTEAGTGDLPYSMTFTERGLPSVKTTKIK